jgi:hypothetical protein
MPSRKKPRPLPLALAVVAAAPAVWTGCGSNADRSAPLADASAGGAPLAPADAGAPHKPADAAIADGAVGDAPDGGPPVDGAPAAEGAPSGPPQTYALTVTAVDRRFVTEDHFIAAVEMQLSGEPLAQATGRDLGGYSRTYFCTGSECQASLYTDPAGDGGSVIDLPGFASAIESYEYSKQPMNNVAFESGAGTSLLFGPVLNPTGATGAAALQNAQNWFLHMAGESLALGRFVNVPDPTDAGANPLGWPGLWPTLQPFTSWDPSIRPTNESGCSLSSDDNRGERGALLSNDYECDYSTLHLLNRSTQVSSTIGPGASGWAGWKEALWTVNYLQVMHGVKEQQVTSVASNQITNVGVPGNVVPGNLLPGTYLGSSDVEGFQAGNFIQILDNGAAQWLTQLTTTDGATLGGFASVADALAYAPSSPLRWFPAAIAVTEANDESGFPAPAAYAIVSSDSHLLDLAGLLGGYATIYALTDLANSAVGGSQSAMVYFDGDPFPVQNQVPAGEATLHDRALAIIRVALVDIDRLHIDPASGVLVDDATVGAGGPMRGATLSTQVAAYALLALRTARLALDSVLTLYNNTRPDGPGVPSPLDGFPAIDGVPFGARLDQLIAALAGAFDDKLTTPEGVAYAGWSAAAAAPTDAGTSVDAHAAAIRGLLLAYLSTGATKYRDRAAKVFAHLESDFYDPSARVYRATPGDRSSQVTFTPRRFGLLQAALRDMLEVVALLPGSDLEPLLLDRIARLDKLVLNGWDDRDEDQTVEWPSECAQLGVGPDGLPLGLGALQMAERTLSGETGSMPDAPDGGRVVATDREHDCVPEISAVGLPSALANAVTFTLVPWSPANEGMVPRDGGWVSP